MFRVPFRYQRTLVTASSVTRAPGRIKKQNLQLAEANREGLPSKFNLLNLLVVREVICSLKRSIAADAALRFLGEP